MERFTLALIACSTVCLACSRGAVHPSAPADGPALVVPFGGTPVLPATDVPRSISARVAAHVPEFGGAYVDGHGSLTVYLTDLSREASVRRALTNELLASGRESPDMRMHYGRYTYADLWRWKTALRPLLTSAGVMMLAVDERANRVVLEMSGSTVALALRQVERYGVPRAAVEIAATARIIEAGSVDGGLRPAVSGLRIAGFFAQNGTTYTQICSYGPNVRDFADTAHHYMVVASHCVQHSPAVGGYIGANVYQPDTTALRANLIGTVFRNPLFSSGGTCPSGGLCRASDAALVRIAPGVTTTLGAIARPVGRAFLPQIYGPTRSTRVSRPSRSPAIARRSWATPSTRSAAPPAGRPASSPPSARTSTSAATSERAAAS